MGSVRGVHPLAELRPALASYPLSTSWFHSPHPASQPPFPREGREGRLLPEGGKPSPRL